MRILKRQVVFSMCVCFFFAKDLWAQNEPRLNKNIVHIEAATEGPFYALNYERIFSFREKLAWSYRVGGFVEKTGVALPLGINAITGNKRHHAEISFIATPYLKNYQSLWDGKNSADMYLYLSSTVGYRYQKPAGKLYGKIAAGPLLSLDLPSDNFWSMTRKLYLAGYLSVGVSFK